MDLFDDDKRLKLKPVVAFNDLLEIAFKDGKCTCARCKENGGSQEGYGARHTFEIDGRTVARQFVPTMPSEVLTVLEKAYKAYCKKDLPAINDAIVSELQAMANDQYANRVRLVLEVSGLLGGAENGASEVDYLEESADSTLAGDLEPV